MAARLPVHSAGQSRGRDELIVDCTTFFDVSLDLIVIRDLEGRVL